MLTKFGIFQMCGAMRASMGWTRVSLETTARRKATSLRKAIACGGDDRGTEDAPPEEAAEEEQTENDGRQRTCFSPRWKKGRMRGADNGN